MRVYFPKTTLPPRREQSLEVDGPWMVARGIDFDGLLRRELIEVVAVRVGRTYIEFGRRSSFLVEENGLRFEVVLRSLSDELLEVTAFLFDDKDPLAALSRLQDGAYDRDDDE